MSLKRRQFLGLLPGLAGAAVVHHPSQASLSPLPSISCNAYTWDTFYRRDRKNWMANPDESLTDFTAAGLRAYEPSLRSVADVVALAPYLSRYGLVMPSVYVNSVLHQPDQASASIATVLAVAQAAKRLGSRLVVTNPSPLSWGGAENKTDSQLIEQAANLNRLGAELRRLGLTLAYHTHDPEFRAGAREFYHMMLHTDPDNVSFCLDAHWVYRGAGNSQVALFDVVKQFGRRVVALHIRQSKDGIWQETLTDGDIDYRRLAKELKAQRVRPLLVLEQCLEAKSPHTLNGVDAHRQSLAYAKEIFAGLH